MNAILGIHSACSFAVQNFFPAILWLLFFGEAKKSDSPKGEMKF